MRGGGAVMAEGAALRAVRGCLAAFPRDARGERRAGPGLGGLVAPARGAGGREEPTGERGEAAGLAAQPHGDGHAWPGRRQPLRKMMRLGCLPMCKAAKQSAVTASE